MQNYSHSHEQALHFLRHIFHFSGKKLYFCVNNMDFSRDNIIIENDLHDLASDRLRNYVAHVLCHEGECSFTFNLGEFRLQAHDSMIVRQGRMVENIKTSDDFKVQVIYVEQRFIELATPQSNYGIQGALSLFLNPVMPLTPSRYAICKQDFENIETRLNWQVSLFHHDVMVNAVQTMIIDFFEFHAHIYQEQEQSTQTTAIMVDFIKLLSRGDYREHRDIAYYADLLCVTPKYLSEVSKKSSGSAANFWINRFTILEISRLLRDKSVPLTEICDRFNFSSPSYFSRYVQNNLGVSPSAYRG